MPLVSVLIPTYNVERYIGEALDSVRAQTFSDFEVVVVDDGSTDRTLEMVDRASHGLRLSVIRQANAGPSAARNAGIRSASGKYCALLDADDLMMPDLLTAQVAVLEGDQAVGLAVTDVETFNERGTVHSRRWRLDSTAADRALERLVLENFVTTSAVAAPTERLIAAGLFSECRRVAEDYELWLRMAARWKVALTSRTLVRYRYTAGSLSADRLYSAQCALDVVEQFFREHPVLPAVPFSLRRRARARHLAVASAAANADSSRRLSIAYALRALGNYPAEVRAWKAAVKSVTSLPLERNRR